MPFPHIHPRPNKEQQMEFSPKVNLYETDETHITEIMAGPWKAIKVINHQSGDVVDFTTDGEEHGVFCIDGSFTAVIPDGSKYEFRADMAMTLAAGGSAKVTAGPYGFKACVVTMRL
jgi:hypothetical protein